VTLLIFALRNIAPSLSAFPVEAISKCFAQNSSGAMGWNKSGPVEYLYPRAHTCPRRNRHAPLTGMFKKACPRGGGESVQQGRSPFGPRSVLPVRKHGTRARTPLAAFFNIPNLETSPPSRSPPTAYNRRNPHPEP